MRGLVRRRQFFVRDDGESVGEKWAILGSLSSCGGFQ